AALLLVCGRGGKDDVSLQSRLGKKHFVDHEQLELAAAIAEGPKMRQRGGTYNIEGLQVSRLRRFPHLQRRQTGLGWQLRAPMFLERLQRRLVVEIAVARQPVGQLAHVGSAARVCVISKSHVADLAGQPEPNSTREAIVAP